MLCSTNSMPNMSVTIGTDAEFFLEKDGLIVPASHFIPGTKEQPFKLDHGVCHPDGLSLEVGCPPSDTPCGMIQNLFEVMAEVNRKYLKPNGLKISERCTVHSEIDIHPDYKVKPSDLEFGCGVELAAWAPRNTMPFKRPLYADSKYRHSGFHIHLGFCKDARSDILTVTDFSRLVQVLDAVFYNACLGTSEQRAEQYGGWGAFRIKPYGLEYRALDCRAITDPTSLRKLVRVLKKLPEIFETAGQRFVYHGHNPDKYQSSNQFLVRQVANELPHCLREV